ncbi:MAG TPA: hypothetical protein VFL51_08425 [Pseudolabrys sp.]|nr:hypothetical protein [Pseudolabrys sp.]
MRALVVASIAVALVSAAAMAQGKRTRFWNLTLYTVTSLQLSPAGEQKWGPNQCTNDTDGTVDHDERLNVTGVKTGRYDVRLADRTGRVCTVHNIDVKEGAIFTIEEKQLTDCRK